MIRWILIGYAAAVAVIAVLAGWSWRITVETPDFLELETVTAERDSLQATLAERDSALKTADAELKKLSASLTALRRQAAKKEDQLNDALRKDPCADRPVDPAVLRGLRTAL